MNLQIAANIKRNIYRRLKLTPMKKVVGELIKRGEILGEMSALELFGYTGEYVVKDYAWLVKSLEVWEIDPACEKKLKKNLPGAKIVITDTYKQIKKTMKKYDLIVADANIYCGEHFEHFDLFPDILKISGDAAILILNVVFDAKNFRGHENYREYLLARKKFYNLDRPEIIPV